LKFFLIFICILLFPAVAFAQDVQEDQEVQEIQDTKEIQEATVLAGDTGFLWLVNRENMLCAKYRPRDLVNHGGIELRAPVRDAYIEMLAAMEADGLEKLSLKSGYRAYSHQRSVFEGKVAELTKRGHGRAVATAIASRSVQVPGASEHQTGLAIDVSTGAGLSQTFAETNEGRWLAQNCHRFGFIIRYPREKTDITNIIYEPWHLRFVGIPHAEIMFQTGKTLEEYHEFLPQIDMYMVWCGGEDSAGEYPMWENPTREYFLVSYSDAPPQDSDVNFSATRYGSGGGYIVNAVRAGQGNSLP